MVAAAGVMARKQGRAGLRIAPVDSSRDVRVHALFETVFGVRKPASWWRWKYGGGRGLAMGGWRGDRLVAHYAGFPRQVRWFGKTVGALQVGDVMVEPSSRGGLTRRGAFQRCAAAFLEAWLGEGKPYWLGFGFPHLRAMLVAERLGLYARVDRMSELHWAPLPDRVLWGSRVFAVQLRKDAGVLERLWIEMREKLTDSIVGVRDPAYLLHRYGHHPEHEYHLFLIQQRWTGRKLGVLVLRREGERCLWVDWVGDPSYLEMAVFQARRLASRFGGHLYTWASTCLARRLAQTEGEVKPLDVYIPTCAWTKGPDAGMIRDRWWLMPGDTDFF